MNDDPLNLPLSPDAAFLLDYTACTRKFRVGSSSNQDYR
jgi:hypothetical protein